MSGRTAVYRLFAVDDTLLYAGVAKRFGTRWEQHAKAQPWWPHVDHQTVYWYPSREDALLIEKAAINAEMPVYNVADSPWRGGFKDDGTGFYVQPKPPPEKRTGTRGTKREAFRVEPELWREYGAACAADETDRSADLRAHMEREVRAWKRRSRSAATTSA